MTRVDIVIPLYNKGPFVARTIKSVMHQEEQDWRLIVVDDGSSDNGPEIVKSFNDPRIELIVQENAGPGPARNTGIAAGNSQYVALLDADDEWYPWYLKNALAALDKNQDIGYVSSLYYEWPSQIDATNLWAARGVKPGVYRFNGTEDAHNIMQFVVFSLPWNTVFRRQALESSDCFPDCHFKPKQNDFGTDMETEFGEDTTLMIRMIMNESFMVIAPPAARYHTECSNIARRDRPQPLEVYLARPEVLSNYCPDNMRDLLERIMNVTALHRAGQWAYHGYKKKARNLIKNYPRASEFTEQYKIYRYYCYVRPRLWTLFKCAIGPPMRGFLRKLEHKTGTTPTAPPMPWETASNE